MRDIRISIRLTKEEHIKFKLLAIKKDVSMQNLLKKFVREEIKKVEESNEKRN